LDEISATTDENARVVSMLVQRENFLYLKEFPSIRLGLVSNLYHLPRALNLFKTQLENSNVNTVNRFGLIPLPSEDYCIFSDSRDWIQELTNYYSGMNTNTSTTHWDTTRLNQIMRARLAGQLGSSVISLTDGLF